MRKNLFIFRSACLYLFLILSIAKAYSLKPSQEYYATPDPNDSTSGVKVEDVSFETPGSVKLTGWFFKQNNQETRRPTVIVAGSDAGNMGNLLFYTGVLADNINVLLFDYRGFGKSEVWPFDSTALMYPEFIVDLEAAVQYVKTRQDVDTANLGLFGLSMGAILCVGVAQKHPEIKVLVADGIATSTSDIINIVKSKKRDCFIPGAYPTNYEPINAIKSMKHCKVFIIAGDKDTNTPLWMAKKLYKAAPNKGELWVIKRAKHLQGPYTVDHKIYTKKTRIFFSDLLKKWPGPMK